MINQLPKDINEFDKVIFDPILIFEKKNFFELDFYNKLREEFPNKESFPGFSPPGKKIYLNDRHKEFYTFMNSSKNWYNFYNFVNTKNFCSLMIDLIYSRLKEIEQRSSFKRYYFNKKYNENIFFKIKRKILKKIKVENIRLGFEFSIMNKNSFIPPHVDTEAKLLSLMIYFPSANSIDNEDKYKGLGTDFYSINDNRSKNMDVWDGRGLNKENTKEFFKNYKVFYTPKFEENKLVGFVKSDRSWHGLSENKYVMERKSLNINIFIL